MVLLQGHLLCWVGWRRLCWLQEVQGKAAIYWILDSGDDGAATHKKLMIHARTIKVTGLVPGDLVFGEANLIQAEKAKLALSSARDGANDF